MQTPSERGERREDGFTLIEIVISLVVFMVAVMGMVALQGASINAAGKSRDQTAAVSIARYVSAELKSEFAGWDKDQETTSFPSDRYPLLRGVFGDGGGVDTWLRYGGSIGDDEGDFRLDEFLGHNALTEASSGASRFCVNYRVGPLEDLGAVTYDQYSVWLIRVRVSWTKEGAFLTNDTKWNVCDPSTVETRILTDASDDAVELVAAATRELAR